MRDVELTVEIIRMYEENYHVCGARTIWKEMGRAGHVSADHAPKAETGRPADLVDRKFVADAPNKLWVADIA